jgi:hypothetical protein
MEEDNARPAIDHANLHPETRRHQLQQLQPTKARVTDRV